MSLSDRCPECDFPLGHHARTCSHALEEIKGKLLSLVERRPPEPQKNTQWTAEQMLQQVLDEVRAGELKALNMLIFYLSDEGDGTFRPRCVLQNISIAERIAYFQLGITQAIDEWRSYGKGDE